MTVTYNERDELVIFGNVLEDGSPDILDELYVLPVPHQQMSVKQAARVDEIKIPGRSGKVKQAVGYEDTTVEINIVLVDDEKPEGIKTTANEQFDIIQNAFRSRDNESLPRVFSISSRLTDRCKIKTVLFVGLSVQDKIGVNDLAVTITLTEFEPIAAQVEKQAFRKKVAEEAGDEAANSEYADELGIEESPLQKAYREGKATAMGGEYNGESPTTDTDTE